MRRRGKLPRLRALLARSRILERISLTPEGTPLSDALRAIRILLDDDARLLSISFHSPSVQPGHTPYVRDAADLRRFYGWWMACSISWRARACGRSAPMIW